ncbi:MAG: diguanylate cyclase (GGDEF)-like protein [Alteromonadaceae bacterium]|jgi:diguanylate cyclase (GGDEF)-like protein
MTNVYPYKSQCNLNGKDVKEKKDYKILAVDDAKDTLMLLEFDLMEQGYQVKTAESGEAAFEILEDEAIDLILLDMYMPGISGLATLQKLKSRSNLSHIPVIMLSASDNEDQIVAALEFGADDYVTKPYIAKVLLARIKTSLRLLDKTLELEALAKTDFLTSLNNRGCFVDLATKAISQTRRTNLPLVMVMLDIDFFKQVNDDFGHDAGDRVLIDFSSVLLECFRDYDISGRIGGEEFAVCMPNTSIDNAIIACERFRTAIEKHKFVISDKGKVINITVSIGLVSGQADGLDFESLLHQADMVLYQAKHHGRNQVMVWDGLIDNQFNERPDIVLADDENGDSANLTEKSHDLEVKQQVGNMDEMNVSLSAADEKYPGIDYDIGVNNVLGDDALFAEILLMFYEDHAQEKNKIQQAITDNDHDSLKHLVHTLKGVSCSIGAMSLFDHTKILDTAINEHQQEKYQLLFDPVAKALDQVVGGIEDKLINKIN